MNSTHTSTPLMPQSTSTTIPSTHPSSHSKSSHSQLSQYPALTKATTKVPNHTPSKVYCSAGASKNKSNSSSLYTSPDFKDSQPKQKIQTSSKKSLYTILERGNQKPVEYSIQPNNNTSNQEKSHKRTKSEQIAEKQISICTKATILKNNYINGVPKVKYQSNTQSPFSAPKKSMFTMIEESGSTRIVKETKKSNSPIKKIAPIQKAVPVLLSHKRSSSDCISSNSKAGSDSNKKQIDSSNRKDPSHKLGLSNIPESVHLANTDTKKTAEKYFSNSTAMSNKQDDSNSKFKKSAIPSDIVDSSPEQIKVKHEIPINELNLLVAEKHFKQPLFKKTPAGCHHHANSVLYSDNKNTSKNSFHDRSQSSQLKLYIAKSAHKSTNNSIQFKNPYQNSDSSKVELNKTALEKHNNAISSKAAHLIEGMLDKGHKLYLPTQKENFKVLSIDQQKPSLSIPITKHNPVKQSNDSDTKVIFNLHNKKFKISMSEVPSAKASKPYSTVTERDPAYLQIVPNTLQNQNDIDSVTAKIKESFSTSKTAPQTCTDFYKIGKLLGKGAFGKVHLGVHKLTGKLVAIKSIKKECLSNSTSKKKVMQEFSILKLLRHDSIIRLYETFESNKHILFVIELCAGGDLLNYVRKRRKLKENHAKFVFKQIIDGLNYCHQKRILHRDIKLDNILLNGLGDIKICDFGVSKITKPNEIVTEQCGTPAYIAPEILKGAGYEGFLSDIWSAGIVLYALLYGTVPFKAGSMHDLHNLIKNGKYTLKDDVSEDARNLLKGMLEINPKKRITIQEIYSHPWLKSVDYNIAMFGDSEKQSILREFAYQKRDDESASDCQFTEQNIDSTLNELTRNISTKSNILAPFNSTIHNEQSTIDPNIIFPKHKIFKLKGKVKDLDSQFEKNNNGELDNGVYNKFVGNKSDSSKESSLNNSFGEDGHCQSKESSQVLNSIIKGEEEEGSRMVVKISTNSTGSFPTASTSEYSILLIR